MRILLVEDDELLADGIKTSLTLANFNVDVVHKGEHAVHALACEQFDLCILDIGLPGISGFDVLNKVRQSENKIPILMLTARDQVADKVRGLDQGADDYLLKPFDVEELKARIRALTRRTHGEGNSLQKCGDVTVDAKAFQVFKGDSEVKLSPKEFSVLNELLLHRGRVLSKDQLTELIYGWSEDLDSNAIEVHVHHLRKKLGNDVIQTIRGVGYKVT
jgi:two-component system response regulator QseB